jgi:hypothetical protein
MNHALVAQTKTNIDRLTPRLSIQPRSAMPAAKGRLTPSISHEINDTPFVVEKREGHYRPAKVSGDRIRLIDSER